MAGSFQVGMLAAISFHAVGSKLQSVCFQSWLPQIPISILAQKFEDRAWPNWIVTNFQEEQVGAGAWMRYRESKESNCWHWKVSNSGIGYKAGSNCPIHTPAWIPPSNPYRFPHAIHGRSIPDPYLNGHFAREMSMITLKFLKVYGMGQKLSKSMQSDPCFQSKSGWFGSKAF